MVGKYKKNYFNAFIRQNNARLWRYDFVEGFRKKVCSDGLVVFEEYVSPEEIVQLFDVGFSVCWDGRWCGLHYYPERHVLNLAADDREFAKAHNMTEIERAVFECELSADEFTEYRMKIFDIRTKTKTYTMLSFDEFKLRWKELVEDLSPPRRAKQESYPTKQTT